MFSIFFKRTDLKYNKNALNVLENPPEKDDVEISYLYGYVSDDIFFTILSIIFFDSHIH